MSGDQYQHAPLMPMRSNGHLNRSASSVHLLGGEDDDAGGQFAERRRRVLLAVRRLEAEAPGPAAAVFRPAEAGPAALDHLERMVDSFKATRAPSTPHSARGTPTPPYAHEAAVDEDESLSSASPELARDSGYGFGLVDFGGGYLSSESSSGYMAAPLSMKGASHATGTGYATVSSPGNRKVSVNNSEIKWCESKLDRYHSLLEALQNKSTAAGSQSRIHLYEELSELVNAFQSTCEAYVKVIVNELDLPVASKSLLPLDGRGVLGGDKFLVDDIFLKFARDSSGLMGSAYDARSLAARKVASHEIKVTRAIVGTLALVLRLDSSKEFLFSGCA